MAAVTESTLTILRLVPRPLPSRSYEAIFLHRYKIKSGSGLGKGYVPMRNHTWVKQQGMDCIIVNCKTEEVQSFRTRAHTVLVYLAVQIPGLRVVYSTL